MPTARISLIADVSKALEQIQKLNVQVTSLELFKSLTKAGAKWEGDAHHRWWSEYLAVPRDVEAEVTERLGDWDDENGTAYMVEVTDGHLVGVWIR